MDAVDILKVCFRRWYVMLPILLGAAGVSYQLVQAQETTFTSAASYGLVQTGLPAGGGGGADPNPLGANGGALIGAALEAQLNSRATQQELGSAATRGWGPGQVENGSSYSVEIPQFETTYEVRAWGEDELAVRDVVNRVIEAAPRIADELQDRAGAPPSGRYQPFILAPTQVDELASTSGMKLVVAVMGIGVLMGAAWSIVADRILRQFGRQRAASLAMAETGLLLSEAHEQPGSPSGRPARSPEQPSGSPPSTPTVKGTPESKSTPNGQWRPKQSVAGQPDRGTQQRRRTGGV